MIKSNKLSKSVVADLQETNKATPKLDETVRNENAGFDVVVVDLIFLETTRNGTLTVEEDLSKCHNNFWNFKISFQNSSIECQIANIQFYKITYMTR